MIRTLAPSSRLRITASAIANESSSCTAMSSVRSVSPMNATISASRSSGAPRSAGPQKQSIAPPAKLVTCVVYRTASALAKRSTRRR
jgi:hypothetical protein